MTQRFPNAAAPAMTPVNLPDTDTMRLTAYNGDPSRSTNVADTSGPILVTAKTKSTHHADTVYDDMDIEKLNLREGRDDHFMLSFEQFLQSTTFHGIRYVFEKTEFSLRRLVHLMFFENHNNFIY